MDTLASIGFKADTRDLAKADLALQKLEQSSGKAESATTILIAAMKREYQSIGQSNAQLANRVGAMTGATDAEIKMLKALQDDIDMLKRVNDEEKRRLQGLTALMSAMQEQTDTLGMTQKELLLYKATQLGATEADKAALSVMYSKINAYDQSSKAAREAAQDAAMMAAQVDGIVTSLKQEQQSLTMTSAEIQQYNAAKAGASSESMRLISALQQEIAETRKNQAAIANAEASERQRLASIQAMIGALNQESATLGMSNKELALYKAAQLGATQADKQAIISSINKIEAYERATMATRAQTAATVQMSGSLGQGRMIMQSFGYQIQDTIVQAQMGANAFLILSQQGSQFASAFGPGGAVAGAFIALAGVAGMVLAPSLMDSKTEAEKLTAQMDKLGEAAQRNEAGVLVLTEQITELAKQSKVAADAQLQALLIQTAQAMKTASAATADMIDELTAAGYGLYDVSDAMKELNEDFGYFGSGRSKAFTETVTEIGEKFGATGDAAEKLGIDVLKAIRAMESAKTPDGINAARDSIIKMAQAAKLSDAEMATLVIQINKYGSQAIEAAESADLFNKAIGQDNTKAAKSATDKILELTQQTALAKEEFINGEVAATKLALAFELGLKSASELTPELSKQVEELVKWKNAGKEVEAQIKRIAAAEDKLQDMLDGEQEILEIEKERIANKEKLIEAMIEPFEEGTKAVKEYQSISEKAAERIEQAFSDAWMNAFDGFESVVDGMKNAFKRMLAEMAHLALTRPIMVSLGMGGMLPAGANAAGTASSLSSGLGLLGGIGGGLVSAGGMIGGAFGGGLAGAGGLIGAGNVGGLFSGAGSLLGSGNIAAGLGMSMPIIAGAVVAAMGINKLTGGGLFGTSYKTTGQDLGLSLGGGDVSGMITTEESKKKSLFRGTSRRTSTSAYDASALDSAFDQITAALGQAANTFGIEGADAIINGFSSSVKINIKDKTEAEIQQAISDWVGSTTTGLVNAVFGNSLDGLQREGEGVIDTVNRLSANMSVVKSITQSLGLNFELTGKAAMIASTNIVDLAGGIENLAALSSQYYQSFYTDAERQTDLQKLLAESFGELNLVIPASRDEFRSYVDALDLTTEAGQQAFAALMQLVPGMDQYLTAVESATEAARNAAQAAEAEALAKAEALKSQGLDLQLRLYDALGQSSEALALRRQLELEATDESLRAMLLSVYAAQDAATAQQELERAQSQAADAARDAANAMQDMIAAAKSVASDAFGKLQESADREKDRLATELDLKLSAIDAERDALKEQRDSVVAGYQEQGKAVEQYLNKLEGLNEVLTGFLSSTGAQANPFKELAMIYTEAKAGLLPDQARLQSVLSGVSSNGSAGFGSAFEQARAMSIARNQALGIQGTVGREIGGAKSQVQWLEQQTIAADEFYTEQLAKLDQSAALAQELHDSQVTKIDEQLSEAQKQLNVLLGVDDRLLTIDEALSEFYAAMDSANLLQLDVGMEQVSAINAVEAAVIALHESVTSGDAGYWAGYDTSFTPPPMQQSAQAAQPLTQEMVDLLKELVAGNESIAKHTKTSADALELNQYELQEAAV